MPERDARLQHGEQAVRVQRDLLRRGQGLRQHHQEMHNERLLRPAVFRLNSRMRSDGRDPDLCVQPHVLWLGQALRPHHQEVHFYLRWVLSGLLRHDSDVRPRHQPPEVRVLSDLLSCRSAVRRVQQDLR